jgi:hypothetical protein
MFPAVGRTGPYRTLLTPGSAGRHLHHMPRFFFDIADSVRPAERDAEGLELADLKQARARALETLGEIARDELPDGDRREFHISVREDGGRILLTASLSVRVVEHT